MRKEQNAMASATELSAETTEKGLKDFSTQVLITA